LWLLLSLAGLPALILIGLCARLIRMKRNKESLSAVAPISEPVPAAPAGFDDRIHRQVLDQQIDAVFDVLTTLIESERCKLKALVSHALPVAETAPQAAAPAFIEKAVETCRDEMPAPEANPVSLSQNIATLADEGMAAGEISRHLGVSLSEVTLALKLKAGHSARVGRKVVAVA
jgi:hypothetical protein